MRRAVVEAIARTYGYTQVSAYRLQGETLVLQHQVGYERVLDRIPITRGVMGRTVRARRPVLLADVRSDPEFLGAIEGIASEVCVPLLDEGGADIREAGSPPGAVIVSDHLDLDAEEAALTADLPRFSVGPRALHGDHAITLLLNEHDRRRAS